MPKLTDYVHFSDEYVASDNSKLALDYYVLPYNLEKAKTQFTQVQPMMLRRIRNHKE